MKAKKTVMLIALAIATNSIQAQSDLYEKAGTIEIKDQKSIMAGSLRTEKDLFKITLEDVGIYTGHTCGCDAAGFIITKNILGMLFPGQIPSRGTVKVTISEYNMDLIDAITYITGTRLNRGEYTNTVSDFIIDKSIAGNEGTTTLIFERKDNGKKVKVVIDRMVLLTKDEMYAASVIKTKIMKGEATAEEKATFAKSTQDIVRKEILQLPKGAFTYSNLN
jgi:formylmethanofuran dehydrogenase subunit E